MYQQPTLGYAGVGIARYAHELGLDGILPHVQADDAELERANELELNAWLWSGPSSWTPQEWERTRARYLARIRSHGLSMARGGLVGYLADVETHAAWRAAGAAARDELGHALEEDAQRMSVGVTSFPLWPWWRELAEKAPHAWGSPQLYGIRNPARSLQELRARGEPWRRAWGGGYCPTLAGAYRRTPEAQRAYLRAMGGRGILFNGQTMPRPHTPLWDVLHDWARGELGGGPATPSGGAAGGAALLGFAALGLVGLALARSR
jgi:hypothetical protein